MTGRDDLDGVLSAIDGALADDEWPDAMRWSPDPEAVDDAGPVPFDGEVVPLPPQRYEPVSRPAGSGWFTIRDGVPVELPAEPAVDRSIGSPSWHARIARLNADALRRTGRLPGVPEHLVPPPPCASYRVTRDGQIVPAWVAAQLRPEAARRADLRPEPLDDCTGCLLPQDDLHRHGCPVGEWLAVPVLTHHDAARWQPRRPERDLGPAVDWQHHVARWREAYDLPAVSQLAVRHAAEHDATLARLVAALTSTPEQQRQLVETAERVAAAVGQTVAAIARAFADLAEALAPARQQLVDAGVLPDKGPTDPRERALWARRNRNTGPDRQVQHRPRPRRHL